MHPLKITFKEKRVCVRERYMFVRNVNMTFSHSAYISRIDGYEEKYLKKKAGLGLVECEEDRF